MKSMRLFSLSVFFVGLLAGCSSLPGFYKKIDCGGEPWTSDGWEHFSLDFLFDFNKGLFDFGLRAKLLGRPEDLLQKQVGFNSNSPEGNLRNKLIAFAKNFQEHTWYHTDPIKYKKERQSEFDSLKNDIQNYLTPYRSEICGECAAEGGCMPQIEMNLDLADISVLHYNAKETVILRQKNRPKKANEPKDPPFLKVSCTPCADAKCLVDPVIGDAGGE
jgi:hypothetical protein